MPELANKLITIKELVKDINDLIDQNTRDLGPVRAFQVRAAIYNWLSIRLFGYNRG